jgi:Arc/MetJ-type ribon-helix-helix transcriptional regulator
MEDNKTETVSAKISGVVYLAMKELIKRRGYLNESDFIRGAIEEKIDREKQ